MCVCVCRCIYIYVYIHIYTYIYVYVCKHIGLTQRHQKKTKLRAKASRFVEMASEVSALQLAPKTEKGDESG